MKKKTKLILAFVGVLSFALVLPSVISCAKWNRSVRATKSRILDADHVAVLSACRELMSVRSNSDEPFIFLQSENATEALPRAITSLNPNHLFFQDGRMDIVFFSGHYHLWIEALAEGEKETSRDDDALQLIPDLWLLEF